MRLILSDYAWYLDNKISLANEAGLSTLLSFFYAKKSNMDAIKDIKGGFWLDSGVFTARKKGLTINTKDIINHYNQYSECIRWCFNNDHGEVENQFKNLKIMVKAGLPTIGIFHGKTMQTAHGVMDMDDIDRMLEITPYIAIGANMKNKAITDKYLDNFFNYIHKKNYWPLKIHLLGNETAKYLLKYPFYSCDTSTYAQASVWGDFSYLQKDEFRIKRVNLRNSFKKALNLSIKAYNRADIFTEDDKKTRANRLKDAILARGEIQKMITEVWKKRGVTWEDEDSFS